MSANEAGRRLARFDRLLVLSAPYLVTFGFVGFLRHLGAGDMWVRMTAGRLVLDNLDVPRHDEFSFTAYGDPWLDHEWFLGVVTYLLYSVDYELVVLFFLAVALAPFIILHWYGARNGASAVAMSGLVSIAFLACWRNFTTRPTVLNPLLFVVLLLVIDRRRRVPATGSGPFDSLKDWRLLSMVALMFAWANLHAGFLIGIAALVAWVLASFIESRDRIASLCVLAASILVVNVNPYGFELTKYVLWAVAGDNPDRAYVPEWASPDPLSPLAWGLIPALVAAAYFGIRLRDPFRAIVLVGTAVGVFLANRYQPYFAVSLLFALPPVLGAAGASLPVSRAVRLVVLTPVFLALLLFFATIGRAPTSSEPTGGLEFLRANCPLERVIASSDYSSWLLWEKYPVFIDGRSNQIYSNELLRDYYRLSEVQEGYDDVPSRYGVRTVMFPHESKAASALRDRGWKEVFSGEVEAVLVSPDGRSKCDAAAEF
jgi:hypothetical protein